MASTNLSPPRASQSVRKSASSKVVQNTSKLLKLQFTLLLWAEKKAGGWTWHPAQAAHPGEARFWPSQEVWKQTTTSGVPQSSCPAPVVQRIMLHVRTDQESMKDRQLPVSAGLGTHWHLSRPSCSRELRQLLAQHRGDTNTAVSPSPSYPPVTSSATSIFYSPLCKPAPWGPRPRHGDGLAPWHTSSWRNQGWATSFNLPFLRLQSGTCSSLWHRVTRIHFWMLQASIYNIEGSRKRFSKQCIKARIMHSSQQRCSAFHPGDLRRCIMKHPGSGGKNHYKYRQVLPQRQQACVSACWHTELKASF